MTVFCYDLVPKRKIVSARARARDDFILANPSVDHYMIADELGLTPGFVRMRQRQLGIRKCLPSFPRKRDQ